MIRLTTDQIRRLHELMILETGGATGVRDTDLLDQSANGAFQTYEGDDLYPGLEAKASQLAHSFIRNHPFVDGNKRMGIFILLIFLESNGIGIRCVDAELIELGVGIAQNRINPKQIRDWILRHRTDN